MISPDLLSSATRTHVSSQLDFATSMTESLVDSTEKLMGLNLEATKATIDVMMGSTRQLISTNELPDFIHVSQNALQPQADIIMTYARHLTSIASGTHRQLAKITRAKISENSREFVALLDELGNGAPEGSRSSIGLLKSAINNAASGYEQMMKTTQSAIDQLESTLSAAGTQLNALSGKSNEQSKK